jgi:hypothetical protein
MSFTQIFGYMVAVVVAILITAITLRTCGDRASVPLEKLEDPNAVVHYVGGHYLSEVHPKPGVTCFIVYSNSISCIKD